MAENAKRNAERDEENAKRDAELREQIKRTEATIEELGKKIDKAHETIVGVSNNSGYHAEQYFQNALAKSKMFGGEKYDKVFPNMRFEDKESCGFDIVLINGKSVAIIEVKNRIHPKFVKDMTEKKTAQFRKYFPEYKDYKLYLGIAGFPFDEYVAEEAKKYGVEIDDKELTVY